MSASTISEGLGGTEWTWAYPLWLLGQASALAPLQHEGTLSISLWIGNSSRSSYHIAESRIGDQDWECNNISPIPRATLRIKIADILTEISTFTHNSTCSLKYFKPERRTQNSRVNKSCLAGSLMQKG